MRLRGRNILNFCSKALHFGLFIPLSNLMIIYGNGIFPKCMLNFIFRRRNKIIEQKISSIISDYSYKTTEMDYNPNAPIWYLWLQGEDKMPEIPQLCLYSIRKFSNGHPVLVLSWNNLHEYVDLPAYIKNLYNEGYITSTHFSDILRMALLSQRGGLWLDATVLVTKPLPDEIFKEPIFSIKNKSFGYFVSDCRWTGFCMAGWRNSVLARNVYEIFCEYWKRNKYLIDYFFIDFVIDILYNSNNEIRNLIDEVPYNNENVHKLAPLLCKKFDETQFQELTKDTFLFKLNWRRYTQEELNQDSDNYYYFLKNKFL